MEKYIEKFIKDNKLAEFNFTLDEMIECFIEDDYVV